MNDYLRLLDDERVLVEEHLRKSYLGVFSEDEVASHITDHVEGKFAEEASAIILPFTSPGGRLLDIGSGFGSFVTMSRKCGLDAYGIEIEEFEVAIARKRLTRSDDTIDAEKVFLCGNILNSKMELGSFNLVTLWNVVEHIEDLTATMQLVFQILTPGGRAFLVCPNYRSWGIEAHYRVKWTPKLGRNKSLAISHLKALGKDPKFLEKNVFFRTNQEVLSCARDAGLIPWPMGVKFPGQSKFSRFIAIIRKPINFTKFIFPYKPTIAIELIKPL